MTTDQTSDCVIPSWQDLEEIGDGDGVPTECECCGKPGTPRQQFEHMGRLFATSARMSVSAS